MSWNQNQYQFITHPWVKIKTHSQGHNFLFVTATWIETNKFGLAMLPCHLNDEVKKLSKLVARPFLSPISAQFIITWSGFSGFSTSFLSWSYWICLAEAVQKENRGQQKIHLWSLGWNMYTRATQFEIILSWVSGLINMTKTTSLQLVWS